MLAAKEEKLLRLTMRERKAVTAATAQRYRRATKKEKGTILDEFTQLTRYNRSYARSVLRAASEQVPATRQGRSSEARRAASPRGKRVYDGRVLAVLRQVWAILDFICGKRLAPIIGEVLPRLERCREISCDPQTRAKLLRISPATIDRLLAPDRLKHQLRGRSRTRPGTLLKRQIPLRTFAEWDEARPGFVEIDLVAHDGGRAEGEYLYTLDVTDVYSGWTEVQAVVGKAQVWVFEALKELRGRLPFALCGIDSDNGSEFINDQLLRYCQRERITFTRARPYRKNDSCFVEQKNYTVVRRHVGYQRLTGARQLSVLNELYSHLRLFVNYFQPVMKLRSKERVGSRVKKTYDTARTPYQRLRESAHLDERSKQRLAAEYKKLNPAELKRRIELLQEELLKMAAGIKLETTRGRRKSGWQTSRFLFGDVHK